MTRRNDAPVVDIGKSSTVTRLVAHVRVPLEPRVDRRQAVDAVHLDAAPRVEDQRPRSVPHRAVLTKRNPL